MSNTTSAIHTALYDRFPGQEYAVLFEVGKSTGAGTSGWADAIAMSLWPSRGLGIHGFEIKAYRGDWLREMKNPAKAEDFVALCDYWSIVAVEGIVKPEELPETWGLMELVGGKLKVTKAAPKLIGAGPFVRREFVAAMLRRAAEADRGTVAQMVEKEVERRMKGREERIAEEVDRRTSRAKELIEKVDAIEKLTGINLEKWTPAEEVAGAVKFALDSGLFRNYGGMRSLANDLRQQAEKIEKAFAIPKELLGG